jgi:hypothetical protein
MVPISAEPTTCVTRPHQTTSAARQWWRVSGGGSPRTIRTANARDDQTKCDGCQACRVRYEYVFNMGLQRPSRNGRAQKVDDNIRQHLRAEYLRGDVDYLHVIHVLRDHMTEADAAAMADRWQMLKRRQFKGDE